VLPWASPGPVSSNAMKLKYGYTSERLCSVYGLGRSPSGVQVTRVNSCCKLVSNTDVIAPSVWLHLSNRLFSSQFTSCTDDITIRNCFIETVSCEIEAL